ncbi:MAG: ABC transporter ATP-binding protein [Nocardioides sp.]
MAKVTFSNIGQSYDKNPDQETWALKPIDIDFESGMTYGLVGPSGCGKTTMLNLISGIVRPTQGAVLFDDEDVTQKPIAQRNVAQVFQFPTIYKQMTVFDNLAFPLTCRRMPKAKIKSRVEDIAEQIGIAAWLGKSANKLRADEKQLVSLGRGLIRDDVTALLMDEPLTVIDPQYKSELRRKIKKIVEGKQITIIYVTHDQYEAMTFADEVLVMSYGRPVQRGTPEELFERPNTRYVGNFIGSPAMNFLNAEIVGGGVTLAGQRLVMSGSAGRLPDGPVEIGIRPEYVQVSESAGPNVITVDNLAVSDMGSTKVLTCKVGDEIIRAKIGRQQPVPKLGPTKLLLPPDKVLAYRDGHLV